MSLFNVRVYGILLGPEGQILVSDEFIRGAYYTKFPGGGLEFGEGTRDCLKREFLEEMGLNVDIKDHIYTTDFFQMSAFNPEHQIISVYYFAVPAEPITTRLSETPFDFDEKQLQTYEKTGEIETFRFIERSKFHEDLLTLPIDKVVARMIRENIQH